jgi:prepilin-type N-terminal cleavage/methylation domain-containing protein
MINKTARRHYKPRNSLGFTLIELLIVVSLLGILAGLTLTVLNTSRQKKVAEDAVRRSNIEKLAQAIESFCAAEGKCPTATEVTNYSTSAVSTYVKQWPASTFSTVAAENVYNYYADSTTNQNFEVSIKMMSSTKSLRYNSFWGQIKECANLPTAYSTSCT